MKFKINIGKDAKKALDKLDEKERLRVLSKIKDFGDWMEGKSVNIDIRKLKGQWEGYYRLRIGKIRILISVQVEGGIIKVYDIGYRRDIYK